MKIAYLITAAWVVVEAIYLISRTGKLRSSSYFEVYDVVVSSALFIWIAFLLFYAGTH